MIDLLILDASGLVDINKIWIQTVPPLNALLKRDKGTLKGGKGTEGDYRGDKKLKARREFTYIYHNSAFVSPIRTWEEFPRREEALKYAGLVEKDLDEPVIAAEKEFQKIQHEAAPSLKTLESLYHSLEKLNEYYNVIDFSLRDKKGELVNNPNAYLMGLERINKAYDSVERFEKRVEAELASTSSIRGKSILGRREGQKRETWAEGTAVRSTAAPVVKKEQNLFDVLMDIKTEDLEEDD